MTSSVATEIVGNNVIDQIVQYGLPSALLIVFIFISLFLVNTIKSVLTKQIDMQKEQMDYTNSNISKTLDEVKTIVQETKSCSSDIKNEVKNISTSYDTLFKYNFQEIDSNIKRYFLDIEHKTEKISNLISSLDEETIGGIVKSSQFSIQTQLDKFLEILSLLNSSTKYNDEINKYFLDIARKEKIEKIYNGIKRVYTIVKRKSV